METFLVVRLRVLFGVPETLAGVCDPKSELAAAPFRPRVSSR